MHGYEHGIYQTNEHLNFETQYQYQYNQKYLKMSTSNFRKKSDIFWFIIFSMQKARLGCVVWVLHKSGGQKERQSPIFQVWISLYTALLRNQDYQDYIFYTAISSVFIISMPDWRLDLTGYFLAMPWGKIWIFNLSPCHNTWKCHIWGKDTNL